jgi:hypothetical protein
MAAFARTPILPKVADLSALPAHLRRSPLARRIDPATSLRTHQFDPKATFKIGLVKGRKERESGHRPGGLGAVVKPWLALPARFAMEISGRPKTGLHALEPGVKSRLRPTLHEFGGHRLPIALCGGDWTADSDQKPSPTSLPLY